MNGLRHVMMIRAEMIHTAILPKPAPWLQHLTGTTHPAKSKWFFITALLPSFRKPYQPSAPGLFQFKTIFFEFLQTGNPTLAVLFFLRYTECEYALPAFFRTERLFSLRCEYFCPLLEGLSACVQALPSAADICRWHGTWCRVRAGAARNG